MAVEWEDYVETSLDPELVDRCRSTCVPVFAAQREVLSRLHSALKPRRIACMGSGCLNDIPMEVFLAGGSEVYLIDWIPRISESGRRSALICEDGQSYACLFCTIPVDARRFCARFHQQAHASKSVCAMEDESVDLVTSAMVASQFEHEPYLYFSRLLAERFGDRLQGMEDKLAPLMERLRDKLFQIQIEGHVREMYRIVNKDRGRVFFSMELFRSMPEGSHFFLAQHAARALEILDRFFLFDFDLVPSADAPTSIPIDSGLSVLQSYALAPRRERRA